MVLCDEFLKGQQRITCPTTRRSAKGIVNGGILKQDDVVAKLEEETRKKKADETAKTARKTEGEAKRLADPQTREELGNASGWVTGKGRAGRGTDSRGRGGAVGSAARRLQLHGLRAQVPTDRDRR